MPRLPPRNKVRNQGIRGWLDVPLPTKSLYKPYNTWLFMGKLSPRITRCIPINTIVVHVRVWGYTHHLSLDQQFESPNSWKSNWMVPHLIFDNNVTVTIWCCLAALRTRSQKLFHKNMKTSSKIRVASYLIASQPWMWFSDVVHPVVERKSK